MKRIDAAWLKDESLQKLLAVLSTDGEEARVAGGAVRNALLSQDVADVDVATTTVPDETIRRAKAAGFKVVPTGYEHGTVTVIAAGKPFEVTTLRADVETDGRHAVVQFGRDWNEDAARRDFTINAIYAKADGTIVDLVEGVRDIETGTLRFIGDAEKRIKEDYLRILRFFRFFAWYGRGRPDAEGIKACARLKDGMRKLSAERVWAELKKLLSASDPSRALLWMRQTGVLTTILPESEKWGIDTIHGLVEAERALHWELDPMLRLASMLPPDAERMRELGKRLRLSLREAERLELWAETPMPSHGLSEGEFRKTLYLNDVQGLTWRLKLAIVTERTRVTEDAAALEKLAGYQRLLKQSQAWERPQFPVSGKDLLAIGFEPGMEVGKTLSRLEQKWVESGFALSKEALLAEAESK
ncbi:cytidine(C)-cytidine(C)-adenosine (A)]-adding enzyme [Nitratireductor aestuarii]|uniref:Cytidine(C)-cytidine(C)-adenosine (A)]-adding enzyme n=1 Tax=Nitratireductor aestuarii TaxID=1735103 RepID=A0A916RWC4_9HYPH|nr:CCA tRNA nucleotidyltransferase [Nitratireductor aestuarii]GGA70895.1 cytidine(C)-cytidine(C)-adenosine (A)]-adding enzyme [Nitratireductor aestuarii]